MASCNGSLVSDLRQRGVYGEQLELEQAFLGVLSIYLSSSPSIHPSFSQSFTSTFHWWSRNASDLGQTLPIGILCCPSLITSDLHLAAEGQWSGGRGIHWHQHLHPSAAKHQEPDPGSRCIQVNKSAALPGRVSHSVPCQQGMFILT